MDFLSEFSITLSENGENYKDAVIANRRVFICNVSMLDENAPSFTDNTCDYNNDPTITMDSTSNIKVGMSVSGTGIPTGATVIEVTSATTFELSASTTGGSVTNGTLTFSNIVKRMRDRIMLLLLISLRHFHAVFLSMWSGVILMNIQL